VQVLEAGGKKAPEVLLSKLRQLTVKKLEALVVAYNVGR
jgi:hypothetical protein